MLLRLIAAIRGVVEKLLSVEPRRSPPQEARRFAAQLKDYMLSKYFRDEGEAGTDQRRRQAREA
jgi:hypothetical protein